MWSLIDHQGKPVGARFVNIETQETQEESGELRNATWETVSGENDGESGQPVYNRPVVESMLRRRAANPAQTPGDGIGKSVMNRRNAAARIIEMQRVVGTGSAWPRGTSFWRMRTRPPT